MSIEMLTPLFTPTTQVSVDDSRHEVRLTIADDVQAILGSVIGCKQFFV